MAEQTKLGMVAVIAECNGTPNLGFDEEDCCSDKAIGGVKVIQLRKQ
jgi:hypothetical protein